MFQRITKNDIKESSTEQLTEMYYGHLKSNSLRLAQGLGTDEALGDQLAEVVAEMNYRKGNNRDLQPPQAA